MDEGQHTNQFTNVFNKVQPVRGFEDILTQIYNAIFDNQLKSGDRLPSERELANMFEVSRTTVRDAIRILEAEKVVEVKRGVNGGISISEPNPEQVGRSLETLIHFRGATFAELAEFRMDFEGKTAYLAARRASKQQIDQLITTSERFNMLVNDPKTPWSEIIEVDIKFHEQVAYASKNQIHIAIMLGIQSLLRRTSLNIKCNEDLSFRKQQGADLIKIAQAISDKDPDIARLKMMEHVEANITSIIKQTSDKKKE